jgi:hypothetical protein
MLKNTKIILLLIFIVGAYLRSTELMQPAHTESWREADVATIAKNIYLGNADMFHPQIAWDGSGPGYTESEFQLYTQLIAAFYKVFGFWEPAGRLISFVFSLATLLVFFKLSRFLFNETKALFVAFVFAISPLPFLLANTIQPESVMFFFYVSAAYAFMRWLATDSSKHYIGALLLTMLALLCKITAAHIGLFFVFLIVQQKGWRFLWQPKTIVFGILSITPAIAWYLYSMHFYRDYGNSLGVSNEYAWIGADFFTNAYFIKGLIARELENVWMKSGVLLVVPALLFTTFAKQKSTHTGLYWLVAAFVFYLAAVRTTADTWAYYYHVFSVPAAAILIGGAIQAVYEKYIQPLLFEKKRTAKSIAIAITVTVLSGNFAFKCYKYLTGEKNFYLAESGFYKCVPQIDSIVPKNAMILATGGAKADPYGYQLAMNKSYFFYWLWRKGYNIAEEDQSIEAIKKFKEKGTLYFIAEESALQKKEGFINELNAAFEPVLKCNGIILYKL